MRRSDRLTGNKRLKSITNAAARPQPAVATKPAAAGESTAAPAPAGPASEAQRGFRFVDRRALLRLAGTAAVAAPASTALAACSGSSSTSTVRKVRIGLVTPQSGTLYRWADADLYIADIMKDYFAKNGGLSVGGTTHPVEIHVRDSESTFARAGKAASQLIYDDGVDIVLVDATTDTVVPVADQCEAMGIPCISTLAPWESFFYGRGGDINKPFTWTYHFFAGAAEYIAAYSAIWNQQSEVPNNRRVGLLLPDDLDGQTFRDHIFRQYIDNPANGFAAIEPTPVVYTPGKQPFTDIAALFQSQNVHIVTGILSVEDFKQFLHASSGRLAPRIGTISRAAMFSEDIKADDNTVVNGLTTEMFWSPDHNFRSSLTNQTAKQLADAYENTGSTWSQQLGASMALFDVAAEAIRQVNSIDDKASIAKVLRNLTATTMIGKVTFGGSREGVPANVATIPLNGGQWLWVTENSEYRFRLFLVNNAGDTTVDRKRTLISMPAHPGVAVSS
jgi:branched-chain amino acid transport system substrate-binding protein